jgi:PUA domain protein
MFGKFDPKEDIIGENPLKTTAWKSMRDKIIQQYPTLEETDLELILPKKKEEITVMKCTNHIELVKINHVITFFKGREETYFPTLKLLHQCKFCWM